LVPVHPGQPGVRPFWNRFSRRFIYPPAFAFEEVNGAERYRFTALSLPDSGLYTFEADRPWVPLTPFWTDLPYSDVQLTVEAIGLSEQDTAVLAGTRGFVKSPPFSGPYGEPAYDYGESGRRCLADLLAQPKLQYWLTVNEPDPSYPLWVHPSKMVRGIVQGMVAYSRVDPRPEDADQALEVAKRAARFLLSLSEPQGAPLAAWPPTYWDGVDGDIHPVYAGEHMALEPAEVAQAYLDLFDATGDSLYLRAAAEIAETYVRLQREDGTWYQLIETATGGPVKEHLLVPVSVINLFDRLARQYGTSDYRQARTSALEWCMTHPVRTFSWEAQYEDTRPRERYKNLSHREPLMLATLLLGEHPMDPEMVAVAEELIRFAEDQFVVWEITDPITRARLFRPGSRWNGNDPYFGSDWFVPSAAEQYVFFTPISAATSFFIDAYVAAFTTTGKRTYIAKAVSLANTITIAQRYWGGREIPTHLRKTMPELNWINVSVKAATSLIRHRDVLTAFYGR
jgi:maltose/maltodextrin transport system substrate-binding protein